jgi:hypothetical protein
VVAVGGGRWPVVHGDSVHSIELDPSSTGQQLVEFNVRNGNTAMIIDLGRSAGDPLPRPNRPASSAPLLAGCPIHSDDPRFGDQRLALDANMFQMRPDGLEDPGLNTAVTRLVC